MVIATTDPDITLMTEAARVTIGDQSGERSRILIIEQNLFLNSYGLIFIITEVVIGFETVAYEVSEGQNLEFCVAVQDGTLEVPIEVTLTTEDWTALGKACSS